MILIALFQAFAGSFGSSPDDYVRQARKALRNDDYEGARRFAEAALETPGAHDQEASWLMGLSWQYDGFPVDALGFFHVAREQQPLGSFVDAIDLSIAEALSETGEHKAALKALRKARRHRTFAIGELERFELDRAMWKLEFGSLKRGTKRLIGVLDDVDHDLATWQQAKARTQLANQWLDIADELGVRTEIDIERRALLVANARKQLDETVELNHDRYTLAQLHRLGTSFERLGDDVVTRAGQPDDLVDEDRQKVENVWLKALSFYDLAERHATRVSRTNDAKRYAIAINFIEAKVDLL